MYFLEEDTIEIANQVLDSTIMKAIHQVIQAEASQKNYANQAFDSILSKVIIDIADETLS